MLERAGEADAAGKRCEGDDGCERWQSAKGDTYEEKLTACEECPKKCLPPPSPAEAAAGVEDEITELVDTIESLIEWEDAGVPTDWTCYGFAEMSLVRTWRTAEAFVHRQQQARISGFIKAWCKQEN